MQIKLLKSNLSLSKNKQKHTAIKNSKQSNYLLCHSMLVEELFIILLDISDLYGVRYLFTICTPIFFSLNKLLDIFGTLPGPLPQNQAPGQHTPLTPLSSALPTSFCFS